MRSEIVMGAVLRPNRKCPKAKTAAGRDAPPRLGASALRLEGFDDVGLRLATQVHLVAERSAEHVDGAHVAIQHVAVGKLRGGVQHAPLLVSG